MPGHVRDLHAVRLLRGEVVEATLRAQHDGAHLVAAPGQDRSEWERMFGLARRVQYSHHAQQHTHPSYRTYYGPTRHDVLALALDDVNGQHDRVNADALRLARFALTLQTLMEEAEEPG